jgi:hypothetical protein
MNTVVGVVFESRSAAERARTQLAPLGIPERRVNVLTPQMTDTRTLHGACLKQPAPKPSTAHETCGGSACATPRKSITKPTTAISGTTDATSVRALRPLSIRKIVADPTRKRTRSSATPNLACTKAARSAEVTKEAANTSRHFASREADLLNNFV